MRRKPEPDVLFMPVIPAHRRLRQEDRCKFQARLGFRKSKSKTDSAGGESREGVFPDLAWLDEAVLTEDSEARRQESER